MKKKEPRSKMTPPKFLALGFAGITLIGTILLKLPIATADGSSTPLIDALFTQSRRSASPA